MAVTLGFVTAPVKDLDLLTWTLTNGVPQKDALESDALDVFSLARRLERKTRSDDQVTQSLVDVGFITGRETFVAHFRENVIKKHRLRWLKRQRGER
jgi:hypothetical protein